MRKNSLDGRRMGSTPILGTINILFNLIPKKMFANITLKKDEEYVSFVGADVESVNEFIVSFRYDKDFVSKELLNKIVKMECGIVFLKEQIHFSASRKLVAELEFI